MKITAQEEYGLRILIRIASGQEPDGMTIMQLSQAEGLSSNYVAKLTRLLRQEGFINSTPGKKGGYFLAKPASSINMREVIQALGGSLFDENYCGLHSGLLKFCTNSTDCSSRSLWRLLQYHIDKILDKIMLSDLVGSEKKSENFILQLLCEAVPQLHTEEQQ